MVRAAALAFLLLAACNGRSDSTHLADQTGQEAEQINQIQARLDTLETRVTDGQSREMADALNRKAEIDALRNAFNDNLKIENDNDQTTYDILKNVDERVSRYDGKRITR